MNSWQTSIEHDLLVAEQNQTLPTEVISRLRMLLAEVHRLWQQQRQQHEVLVEVWAADAHLRQELNKLLALTDTAAMHQHIQSLLTGTLGTGILQQLETLRKENMLLRDQLDFAEKQITDHDMRLKDADLLRELIMVSARQVFATTWNSMTALDVVEALATYSLRLRGAILALPGITIAPEVRTLEQQERSAFDQLHKLLDQAQTANQRDEHRQKRIQVLEDHIRQLTAALAMFLPDDSDPASTQEYIRKARVLYSASTTILYGTLVMENTPPAEDG